MREGRGGSADERQLKMKFSGFLIRTIDPEHVPSRGRAVSDNPADAEWSGITAPLLRHRYKPSAVF
jgi:hypothetical protein